MEAMPLYEVVAEFDINAYEYEDEDPMYDPDFAFLDDAPYPEDMTGHIFGPVDDCVRCLYCELGSWADDGRDCPGR